MTARRSRTQDLGFTGREFVLCGLPYKKPKSSVYKRRNGNFLLKVVGDPDVGVPYGQDRLIPIWLATAFKAAGQPLDNVIRFRSAMDILRAFDLPGSGPEFKLLGERLRRTFGATYFAEDLSRGGKGLAAEGYRLIRRIDLWVNNGEGANQHTLWQNTIELTVEFAAELRGPTVPIDLDSVRALKESPAALDLYVWQAWRSYRLSAGGAGPLHLSVLGEHGLLAQLGTETANPRKLRQQLRHWQGLVKAVWPECPNTLSADARTFVVRPALAVNPSARLTLPGVSEHPPVPRRALEEAPHLHLLRAVERP